MTATLPKLTEREFMDQVTQLAELRGWSWAHFRPAQTAKGWRTPVSGPLGKGWPDLVLTRRRDFRILFAELKREGAKPTPDQSQVLFELRWVAANAIHPDSLLGQQYQTPYVQVEVWTPADWDDIERALR